MASVSAKTLFVHNLPKEARNEQLADVFSDIGPIKRCHIVFDKETHKSTGKGYVTFAFDNDAETALKSTIKLGNNVLKLKYTTSKEQMAVVKNKKSPQNNKERRKLKQEKKRRVIIRNLSFNATEDKLKDWISKFGSVKEVNIPKKENGKMLGFAFVTFDNMKTAVKTIKELNAKEFLNRKVAIDFAIAKEKYNAVKHDDIEEENDNDDNKDEDGDDDDGDDDNKDEDQDDELSDDEDAGPDDETLSIKSDNESEMDEEEDLDLKKKKKRRKESNDVSEGKTVFVKNLSFDTTTEKLEEVMQSFGETDYCIINEDPVSGHSRGTAFVKFKVKESADECIERSNSEDSSLFIDGRQVHICLAMSKNDLHNQKNSSEKKVRDKRNLFLAKEGLIYPKSPAAKDVSQSDLSKRLNLEQRKRKLLTNNLYFVSNTRLHVLNLPEEINDAKLKRLFLEAVDDKSAVITEAKVMRNFVKSENKLGKSKGFGFVTFKDPKHALIALRRLNNNPNTFSKHKRPIVEFSIESRLAVNQKMKRNEKMKKIINLESLNKFVDVDVGDFPYMGVKAKPLNEKEKVTVPKLNRKIFEARKDLKQRGKVVKSEQRAIKQDLQVKKNKKEKAKNRRENKQLHKVKEVKEMDDFEEEFLRKRKTPYLEENPKKEVN
ncbi:RNA recognition motif-containing protein-like protein, partial [Leptotrombidium deliense]